MLSRQRGADVESHWGSLAGLGKGGEGILRRDWEVWMRAGAGRKVCARYRE